MIRHFLRIELYYRRIMRALVDAFMWVKMMFSIAQSLPRNDFDFEPSGKPSTLIGVTINADTHHCPRWEHAPGQEHACMMIGCLYDIPNRHVYRISPDYLYFRAFKLPRRAPTLDTFHDFTSIVTFRADLFALVTMRWTGVAARGFIES